MNDVIPNDWELVNLGTLGSFAKGAGIRKDEALSGEIPAVRYGELYTDHPEILRAHRSFISAEISKSARPIKCGDILFAGSGETKEEIGKCTGFLGDYEAFAGGDIIVFRPNGPDPRFLAYMLNSAPIAKQKAQRAQGDAVVHIYPDALSRLSLPLPSLHEQQAIAAALSDADGVVAGLERVIAKKRLIKQGAMQDLLTARRRLPGFSGEWEAATISEVAHVDPEALGAGTPKEYAFRYISLEDVNQGVLSGWTDVAFGSAPSRARRVLQKDDVLLGTVRPNLKSHMLFDRPGSDWVGSTGFAVLRLRPEKCIPGYLFELIMSDVIGRQIDEVIAGSNYPAISNSDVRKLKLMLPAIEEQKAISHVLRDMDSEIQTLEARLTKARAIKEGMMQNLLTGRVRLV